MLTLTRNNHRVVVNEGELVSYQVDGYEYIHQKGDPGWKNSDTEMFPIIGPTADAGFRVHVPRGNAIQDQHGLLRDMDYELAEHSDTKARYRKVYTKGTIVMNSKFPEKSTAQRLIWPFDFTFEKQFDLSDEGLIISFLVSGEKDMPFMLGYHPAFKLYSQNPSIKTENGLITLEEILEAGSSAFELADCEALVLIDNNEVVIETEGFGHFMLWTEVPNMVCIEPITFYPYAVAQEELHEGFIHLDTEEKIFRITLKPTLSN